MLDNNANTLLIYYVSCLFVKVTNPEGAYTNSLGFTPSIGVANTETNMPYYRYHTGFKVELICMPVLNRRETRVGTRRTCKPLFQPGACLL